MEHTIVRSFSIVLQKYRYRKLHTRIIYCKFLTSCSCQIHTWSRKQPYKVY